MGIRLAVETIPPFLMAGTRALVAGAQATIYQQAQALGQSIYTLLDTMEPVITDPDTADIEALKDTVRSTVGAMITIVRNRLRPTIT